MKPFPQNALLLMLATASAHAQGGLTMKVQASDFMASAPLRREKVAPVVPLAARYFALEDVPLLAGPFKEAMETDCAYLLRLDPDRLLSQMRRNAGLEPKGAPYTG